MLSSWVNNACVSGLCGHNDGDQKTLPGLLHVPRFSPWGAGGAAWPAGGAPSAAQDHQHTELQCELYELTLCFPHPLLHRITNIQNFSVSCMN